MDTLTVVGIIAAIFILFHVAVFGCFFIKAARSGRIKSGAQYPYPEEDFLEESKLREYYGPEWDFDPVNVYYTTKGEDK